MCPACGSMLGVESVSSAKVLIHWRWTVDHIVREATDEPTGNATIDDRVEGQERPR